MSKRRNKLIETLRKYAFSLPGAYEDHPWGESVAKVHKKVFVFFGHEKGIGGTGFCVKLPHSGKQALGYPFAEPAVQVLLRGLSELGRRAEAMRVFRDFRQLLLDDLGIEPDPRTTAAYLDVLRRRPQQTDGPRSLESETRLLFDLLRQALETTGRLDFADTDLALRTLARQLHAAA